MKDLLGIEINESGLALVEVKDGHVKNDSFYSIPKDSVRDGMVVAYEVMSETIKEAVKESSIRSKKVALVIPDEACYLRKLVLPLMSEAQLKVNLPYEFRDVIQGNQSKYIYDYAVIEINEEGKSMSLLAAAINQEIMDSYTTMIARANLKLVKATPKAMTMQQLLQKLEPSCMEKDIAIINFGLNETRMDIYKHGIYDTTRTIETGLNQAILSISDVKNVDPYVAKTYFESNYEDVTNMNVCKDVYSDIAIEVMRALNYYMYENSEHALETLYMCGYGSWVTSLAQEVANRVENTLIPLSSLNENDEVLMKASSALGICLE